MHKIKEDIDWTLDLLLENAIAIKNANIDSFSQEIKALKKTQESLLARLIHQQSFLKKGQKQPQSIRKEWIEKKAGSYAKSIRIRHQKRASSRKARSKS